jgi:hypothetical protein
MDWMDKNYHAGFSRINTGYWLTPQHWLQRTLRL